VRTTRRHLVAGFAAGLLLPWVRLERAWGLTGPGPHPVPRPGITADKVATNAQLADFPEAADAFDLVREIPQIVDGIRCHCGCSGAPGYYSLLTCYEGEHAMAMHCAICQGQGRLAFRLHQSGRTLDQIRAAIDARFVSEGGE
jgi:hypothetical protein